MLVALPGLQLCNDIAYIIRTIVKTSLAHCPIKKSTFLLLKLAQPAQYIFTKNHLSLLFAYIMRCALDNAPFQFAVSDICPFGKQVFWAGYDPLGVFFREER